MITIKPCNSYHGVLHGKELLRGADGKSSFKVYFVDIIGRKERARTEWALCGQTPAQFLARLNGLAGVEGVGFVTAFPHITKVFRFGPDAETLCCVRAWKTTDLSPIDLARGEGYMEFACLAEAVLAAEEYEFWAKAPDVEEYLKQWARSADWPINQNDKLLKYYGV